METSVPSVIEREVSLIDIHATALELALASTRAPVTLAGLDLVFDDATNVIINEVGSLKHMLDEFTKFARLPAPST